jgi:DNA-binding GntR family transcriptional regulator
MPIRSQQQSLAAEAYTIVRRRILCGQIGLGEVVSRRKLAAELGMSFLPITEALLRLEFEGLLESRPRAGTRVRIPSYSDVLGHYVVREALETQAARLFSLMATPAERAALLKLAAQVDACVMSDQLLFMGLHEQLHCRIANCAHTPALSEAIKATHALASTWFCRIPAPEPSYCRHQSLMEVLVQRDPDASARMMHEHINHSREQIQVRMGRYFKMRKLNGDKYSRIGKRPKEIQLKPSSAEHAD